MTLKMAKAETMFTPQHAYGNFKYENTPYYFIPDWHIQFMPDHCSKWLQHQN